jgi:hypothetical protein
MVMQAALALIIKLLPSLVAIAELIFNRPKSGAEKKQWVLAMMEHLFNGADAAFTGGAAETWGRIREPAGVLVDAAANIAFPHGLVDVGGGH